MRLTFPILASLVLVVIGAVNWGLVGFFGFDLVAALFGTMTAASRIVYALVGVAGIALPIAIATEYGRKPRAYVPGATPR